MFLVYLKEREKNVKKCFYCKFRCENKKYSIDFQKKITSSIRYTSPRSDDFLNVFPLISASFLFHLKRETLRLTQKQLRKKTPEEKQLQRRSTFSRFSFKNPGATFCWFSISEPN